MTDLPGLPIVTLLGRHAFDAALAVTVFVLVDDRRHPLTGPLFGRKWLRGQG